MQKKHRVLCEPIGQRRPVESAAWAGPGQWRDDERASVFSSSGLPAAQGLYQPTREHDACGVAFVATLTRVGSHGVIAKALTALRNLEHRGASGCEPDSGDGAGILIQVPDAFLRASVPFELPAAGHYAAGLAFLPRSESAVAASKSMVESIATDEGLTVLGWRPVPTDPTSVGMTARSVMPTFEQLFLSSPHGASGLELDRRVFAVRKRAERDADIYFPSLSSRTIVR